MEEYLNEMCNITSYTPKTDIWETLSSVEENDIENTVENIYKTVKNNYVYLTELVLFLSWKYWENFENKNDNVAKIYFNLYNKYHRTTVDILKPDELLYYLQIVN